MRPERLLEHSRRVEAQSNEWKRKYKGELKSIVFERNAWRSWANHLEECHECAPRDFCAEGQRLHAIAHKLPKTGGHDE